MEVFYNYETFLLFFGGICSFILPVSIIFAIHQFKRNGERERLTKLKEKDPEAIGDIEAKLNDSYDFKPLNFLELLTIYALQPLFIISFINLFYSPTAIETISVFFLIVLIIQHELWSAKRHSKNIFYQLLIFALWIALFLIISNKANNLNQETKSSRQIEQLTKEKDKSTPL